MGKGLDLFKMFAIVPGSSKPFNFMAQNNDIVITWDKIRCIGETVILVEL